jgi:hypothetical protein
MAAMTRRDRDLPLLINDAVSDQRDGNREDATRHRAADDTREKQTGKARHYGTDHEAHRQQHKAYLDDP